jgi:ribonuclease BN (tRNA processing enzyme)
VPHRLTLGYQIVETRRRLKPQFAALTQTEIRQRAQAGGPQAVRDLSEDYEAPLVAWSGDTLPLDPAVVRDCELLFHEATILDAGERKHQWHSTLDEAVQTGVAAKVKNLVLYHVSGRYHSNDIRAAIRQSATQHNVQFPIWCLFRDRLWQSWPESNSITKPGGARRTTRSSGKPQRSQPVFGGSS